MVRQTAAVITFEILGGILLLAIAGAIGLAYLLSRGPVELSVFKGEVENALISARNGRDVDIERLTLQWSPADRRMIVAADGLKLADNDGQLAGEAEQAVITLDAGSLLFGRAEVIGTELRNGWADVRNISPTKWTFAGEPLPEFEARDLPTTPEGWLKLTNSSLGSVLRGLQANRTVNPLETAAFRDMELRFFDASGDLLAQMEDADGRFEQSDDGIEVELTGSGEGIGLPGDVSSALSVPPTYDSLEFSIGITNWSVGDLAARFGIGNTIISGFPADITIGLEYQDGEGVTALNLAADAEDGRVTLAGREIDVETLIFDAAYDPVADLLQLNDLVVVTERASGDIAGSITGIVKREDVIAFDLTSDTFEIDFTPYFPEVWELDAVRVTGSLDEETTALVLDNYEVSTRGIDFKGTADLAPVDDVAEGELPFRILSEGEAEGTITKEQVLAFWPETLGAGARNFTENRILGARVTAANYRLDLKPDSFAEGFLRDEDLMVRFFIEDGAVKFLDDLPPVTDGVGSGRLTGNGFQIQLSEGDYDGWTLTEGSVQFPKLNPKGEMSRIFARGEGPLVNVMRNIANSRLMEGTDGALDPERFSGNATATFEMLRPALDDVPMEDMEIKVSAKVSDASLSDALPGLDLTGADVDVALENMRLVMTGFGDLGPAPVQFTWRDEFGDDIDTADLSASAFISPDFLNRFGIVGRAYVSEDIPVELQAQVAADGLAGIEVGFELQQSRVDISEIGYIKPVGEAARATLSYDAKSETNASTFRYVSENARFDGDVVLSKIGRLQTLDVREAFLDGFMDVSGSVRRENNGKLVSELDGAFLDASAFFGDFGSMGGDASGVSLPITLSAELDTLRLRSGLDLQDAGLTFVSSETGVREVRAEGTIETGGQMSAVYIGPTADDPARISLDSDDAGFFMRALLRQDFLTGGSLRLTGDLARGSDPARLSLKLNDVRMRDAPFLTQVLSLASLRGLADTLTGDGVLFTEIDVPVAIQSGRFVIEGARANGPALGLTLNGWFEQGSDKIRLSGVLVPSFGMNSMLGGVPVIGDLFVGREGEGIFSLTYSVRGTLDRAQVAVNPLSAVTPGVLRRIFENPADTSIPDSIPVDPEKTPPAPPMPDAEFIPSAPGADPN